MDWKFPPQKEDGGVEEFDRRKPQRERFSKKVEKGLKVSQKSMEMVITI